MAERIDDLESRIAAVERRLSALEDTVPGAQRTEDLAASPTLNADFLSSASTLIGRVLLIFGGAFLLRAITDYEFVPTAVGIAMGAAYAVLWLVMAYRNAHDEEKRPSAVFYGGAAVLLGLPLLVEATTRFELLSGQQSIVALTVFCALSLLVAVARKLRSLTWLTLAGGIATAFVIMNASHIAVPVAAFLVILGIASLWTVYVRSWMGPQWLGALGANAGLVVLALVSRSEQWTTAPFVSFLLAAFALLAYLLSFAAGSHLCGRNAGIFEAVQAALIAGIVFSVAAVGAQAGEVSLSQAGLLSLILGVSAYSLAFTPVTRTARGRNFFFYSTLGLALVVAGSALLMSPGKAAVLWSLMAVAVAFLSGRYGWVTLSLQCTFLVIAAGVGSGILATGMSAFAGDAVKTWPTLQTSHILVALCTVICLFIPVAQHSARWGRLAGLPQLIVLAISVWEVGGLMLVILAPPLATVPGQEANLATLAALRTAVLAAASVTLALSGNHRRWPEARWLVYPVLVVVGIKLFVEDFPHGQPVSLFVALALVGGALIVVARLMAWKRVGS